MKKQNLIFTLLFLISVKIISQNSAEYKGMPINPDLFSVFFEDINYAADGGLYAELIQNCSFEYSLNDNGSWNPFTCWNFISKGGIGAISVETKTPVRIHNKSGIF